jgi:hypothetical protein
MHCIRSRPTHAEVPVSADVVDPPAVPVAVSVAPWVVGSLVDVAEDIEDVVSLALIVLGPDGEEVPVGVAESPAVPLLPVAAVESELPSSPQPTVHTRDELHTTQVQRRSNIMDTSLRGGGPFGVGIVGASREFPPPGQCEPTIDSHLDSSENGI